MPQPSRTPVVPETAPGAQRPAGKRDGLYFAFVVVLALAIRGFYYLSVKNEFWLLHPMVDSKNYHLWAQAILAGDWLGQDVYPHSPLYAFALAGMYKLLGAAQPALAALVQLLLGAAACGGVYALARRWFSPAVALAAGLAEACYAPAFFFEGQLLSVLLIHALNLLLLLSSIWAMRRERAWAWLAPGICLGLAYLTRPNILLMLPVLFWWMVLEFRARNLSGLKQVQAMLVLAIAVSALMLPPLLRNLAVLHEPLPSVGNGGTNFYLGNYFGSEGFNLPKQGLGLLADQQVRQARRQAELESGHALTYGEADRYWARQAWREIREHPRAWLGLMARKTWAFFNAYEFTTSLNYELVRERAPFLRFPWLGFGVLGPLGILGMVLSWNRRRELFLLYGLFAVYAFSNISMMVTAEYRYAVMPAWFIFAAAGLAVLTQQVRMRNWPRLLVSGGVLAGSLGVAWTPAVKAEVKAYHHATAQANFGTEYAQAGEFNQAAEAFVRAKRLMARRPDLQGPLALQLGKALLQGDRLREALPVLEEAMARLPQDADAANSLANAYTAAGQWPEALAWRQKVLTLAPEVPDYWVNLGITRLWMGQNPAAQRAFDRALQLRPELGPAIEQTRNAIQGRKTGRTFTMPAK